MRYVAIFKSKHAQDKCLAIWGCSSWYCPLFFFCYIDLCGFLWLHKPRSIVLFILRVITRSSFLLWKSFKLLSGILLQATISTLDLISGDKIEFLVIIAPIEPSYHLAHAALKVAEEFKVSARVCVLWPAGSAKGVEVGSKASLKPWENYIDVMEVKKSSDASSWWDICQMTDKGAILVRPDEHVAWRLKSGVVGDPMREMRRAFSAALDLKSHIKDQEADH